MLIYSLTYIKLKIVIVGLRILKTINFISAILVLK